MKKILVTGANGQLGKELRALAKSINQYTFVFLSREDLPIHHFELVRNYFNEVNPDYCINCAAYTAVDKAETETALAELINTESVGVLAAVTAAHNCRFIHISTDYVYSGYSSKPYQETDVPAPESVYGKTKLAGEVAAMENNPASVIIRTSWVYAVHGHNFVKTMIRLMGERPGISVVNDQIGSPTWAADLAKCIMDIIKFPDWHPGIYNFSNEGQLSWYDFALQIKAMTGSTCDVKPIPSSAYPTPAKRPQYSIMDKSKIVKVFGIRLEPWQESLKHCLDALQQK
jgi:dTDP-4-dehydrorhamnose reductase